MVGWDGILAALVPNTAGLCFSATGQSGDSDENQNETSERKMSVSSTGASPNQPAPAELIELYEKTLLAINRASGQDALPTLMPAIAQLCKVESVALVGQAGKRWQILATSGEIPELPVELISDCLDRGQIVQGERTWVAPLRVQQDFPASGFSDTALVLFGKQGGSTGFERTLEKVSQTLGITLQSTGKNAMFQQRIARLEEMLQISVQWTNKSDCSELLEAVANAATRLLEAERASIFLWERARKKLVGRPALGVAGNCLEVDDRAGVVGAVLQSGQPKRWQSGDDTEAEINRQVDQSLRFKTRNLVAVPLWGPPNAAGKPNDQPKPMGVFEVINRRQGYFTDADIHALQELATLAAAAIENTQGKQRLVESRQRLIDHVAENARVIGKHPKLNGVRDTAKRVADTDLAVLILGENGTGKEVLARSIHIQSRRQDQPFIAVNCAALVESLLESELFGHEKGAFTDAHQMRQGKFELANGGTIFLDEIGDLSPGGQAKLLRVLEEKRVVRVGGSLSIDVDVRVIAATNQPLIEMVREKKFREDLFFRLNTVTLTLPALRERGDDILLLADHFLTLFSNQVGRLTPQLSIEACDALLHYSWPGNIRELRNLMERVSYLCSEDTVAVEDLALRSDQAALRSDQAALRNMAIPRGNAPLLALPAHQVDSRRDGRTLADATHTFQVQQIEQAIAACHGNMTDAAAMLGLHRSNLYRKMRQLGMPTNE